MTNIWTVFLKQIKETFKNKTILIQFILFPAFTFVMENTIKLDGVANMPEHFFMKLFSVMFVGMAPLTCMSSIISEEKEKNTLRALMMSNVKPIQYLLGSGIYVWLMCMIGTVVFAICGKYSGKELAAFMLIMAVGILLSILTGAVIGVLCKNQMTATSVTVPIMMVLSFLPMLSMFNENIEKVAKYTYSQQVSLIINNIGSTQIASESVTVIAVNFLIAVLLFVVTFRKKGLE